MWHRLVGWLVVGTLLAALAAPVAAAPGGHRGGQGSLQSLLQFEDLDEAPWAYGIMVKAALKGLVRGRTATAFAPKSAVKRAEALVMVLRVLEGSDSGDTQQDSQGEPPPAFADKGKKGKGKRAKESKAGAERNGGFTDVDPSFWAAASIARALELGLVEPEDLFHPLKPAARGWVAELLVRALAAGRGLDVEELVAGYSPDAVEFADRAAIPAAVAPYVALAFELGLLTGYEDRTFKSNKPVTRAEMAAFVLRLRGILSTDGDGGTSGPDGEQTVEVRGKLLAVWSGQDGGSAHIRVRPDGASSPAVYPVAPDAAVTLNGSQAQLADLVPGLWVEVELHDGVAVVVEAQSRYQRTGTVTAIDLTASPPTIGIRMNGTTAQYALAADIRVRWDGRDVPVTDIQAGDYVQIRVEGEAVVAIVVVRPAEILVEGYLTGLVFGEDGSLTTVTVDGDPADGQEPVSYPVATAYKVIDADGDDDAGASILQEGDRVAVTLVRGLVVSIAIVTGP